ncbi:MULTISPECIES: glycosyltransferase [unclassified Coleofasciculus]|uniref:glycosyltransferase n=1 Tax=unclassified Coleofasciculus TaxID=2692782 RepID=UPI0018812196|nr:MULTISPECIES: glycosyltransferase [unclassified Coleofasciculus]MBE9125264.1 glycosyltransferase [Coleofasciculus sp. LEGE 07081]MBE9147045.1 glycosyltransferase [Coleofasciculus sp. LEGE 07092]
MIEQAAYNAFSCEEKFMESPTLILIPVFNDWKALGILLRHLDRYLQDKNIKAEVLAVDDASSISHQECLTKLELKAIKRVKILELRRNIGHQRAITIGLAYIEENLACQAVVVMDGDGEDAPGDVLRLIDKCQEYGYKKVIFAQRTKRSETWQFKLFYLLYKCLYKLLTGQNIRIGNFSIIPQKILSRLVVVSEIWNHYAVGVLKAKVPCVEIACRRSVRLAGHPKMNFVSLVTHGLSAISVYGDVVGVRLLVASCLLILLTIIALLVIVTIRVITTLAIPGWTSYLVALFLIIIIQFIMLSIFFIFTILSGRNSSSFIPKRDYHYFVLGVQQVFPQL